jgi:hypothetical protein
MQRQSKFLVHLGANARYRAVYRRHTGRAEESDMPKGLQVLEHLLKSRIQFSDGPVDVDLNRHR